MGQCFIVTDPFLLETVFDKPVDFLVIYVPGAEDATEAGSDTGLLATDMTAGPGPGGPVRLFAMGAIDDADLFSRIPGVDL